VDASIEKAIERAGSLFGHGNNCAEAVLTALLEAAKLNPEDYGAVATAFGGGVGNSDLTCGALSGAILALGLTRHQRRPGDSIAKQTLYTEIQRLTEGFRAAVGSSSCTDILGENLSQPGGRERASELGLFDKNCPRAVELATRLGGEILKSRQK